MATEVASAYVSLIPSYRGGTRRISDALSPAAGGAGAEAGQRFGAGLLGRLRGFAAPAAAIIGGMLAVKGISSAFGFVKDAVVGFNGQLQQSGIAFTTMLGSGQKAQAFLGDLQNFAKSTPFEFPDLVTSSQRLLAMGIAAKDVVPYMTGIGDAVAGLGGGREQINQVTTAIGQMSAKGKIQSDELLQLTEAGIPALKILAAQYHKTPAAMQDMITKGKVLSGDALPKLIAGLEHGTSQTAAFGGMMEKQSHTLSGALSNVKDSLTQTIATAGKPIFDTLSAGVQSFATVLSSPSLTSWAKNFAARTSAGLETAGVALSRFYRGFARGEAGLHGSTNTFQLWGVTVGKVFHTAADMVGTLFAAVKPGVLSTLAAAFTSLKATVAVLKPYFDTLWSQLGPALTASLPSIIQIAQALNPVGIIVKALLPVLPPIADAFGKIAVAVGGALAKVLPPLASALANLAQILTGALSAGLRTVVPVLAHLAGALAPLAPYVLGLWVAFKGYKAAREASIVLRGMIVNAGDAITRVAGLGRAFIANARAAASTAKAVALTTAGYVRNGLAAAASAIRTVALKTAQLAVAAASKAWAAAQWLLNAALEANPIVLVVTALAALAAAIVIAWKHSETFRNIVKAAWSVIQNAVSFAWNNVIKPIFNVFVVQIKALGAIAMWLWNNAIKPAFHAIGAAVSTFGSVVKLVVGAVSSAWHWLHDNVIAPVGAAISAIFHGIGTALSTASGVIHTVTGAISTAWHWLHDKVIKPVGDAISAVFNAIGTALKWVYDHTIGPIIDTIQGAISAVSDSVSALSSGLDMLTGGSGKVATAVGPGGFNPFLKGHGKTSSGSTIKVPHAAAGLTVRPTRGGTPVVIGEAGRAESVVDTGRVNELINYALSGQNTRGVAPVREPVPAARTAPLIGELTLNEVTDAVGTARAVSRRLAFLGV